MKIKIAIEVNVPSPRIPYWLGLEGQELLDAVKAAADSGDEVTCKVQLGARQVRFMPLSTPPMFRGFIQDGSSDDGHG